MASLEHLKVGGRRYAARKKAANPPSKQRIDEPAISPQSIATPSVGKAEGAQSIINNMKPATAGATVNKALPSGSPPIAAGERNSPYPPLVDMVSDQMISGENIIKGVASGASSLASKIPKTWDVPNAGVGFRGDKGTMAVPSGPTPNFSGLKDLPSRMFAPSGDTATPEKTPWQQSTPGQRIAGIPGKILDVIKQPSKYLAPGGSIANVDVAPASTGTAGSAPAASSPIPAAATAQAKAPLTAQMKSTGKPGEVTPVDLSAPQVVPRYTNADLEGVAGRGPAMRVGNTEVITPGGRALSSDDVTNIQKVMRIEPAAEIAPRTSTERTDLAAVASGTVPGPKTPAENRLEAVRPDFSKEGGYGAAQAGALKGQPEKQAKGSLIGYQKPPDTKRTIPGSWRPPGSMPGYEEQAGIDFRQDRLDQIDSDRERLSELTGDIKQFRPGQGGKSLRALTNEYNDLRAALVSSENALSENYANAELKSAQAEQNRSLAEKYSRPDIQTIPEGYSMWYTKPGATEPIPGWSGRTKQKGGDFKSAEKELTDEYNAAAKNGTFDSTGVDLNQYKQQNYLNKARKFGWDIDETSNPDNYIITDSTGQKRLIPKG